MEVLPGTTLGPYTIDREIGRGGMGVVYLGHDARLDRPVAIKAMPEALAQDADRLARFEREARTLASLSHPNVAAIYGVEEQDGRRYLVLEYVEGETLAERLDRGPLPVDDALDVCAQIAAGVEAAHESGVIHRDLKPANIKITPEGQVKVLDFGLAKNTETTSSSSIATSEGPTRTTPTPVISPTNPGAILGTAPYMSPEQARGRTVDKRTDIWSFGVILYECLTGIGPFEGETATDSIGAILHKEVDLDLLPNQTPPMVRHVLSRCLARDKSKRLRDLGDARLELESASAGDAPDTSTGTTSPGSLVRVALISLIVGGGIVGFGVRVFAPAPAPQGSAESRRYTITLPESAPIAPPSAFPFGTARGTFDLSVDGRTLIYTALVNGTTQLFQRDMVTGDTKPIPGTIGGFGPFLSPDALHVGYFARERLYRMNLERPGNPEEIADANSPWGATWAANGTIYFSPTVASAVLAIPSSGGQSTPTTVGQSLGTGHFWPHLLPGEHTLLFTGESNLPIINAVPIGSPSEQRMLIDYASDGRYVPTGHLLFMREDRLMAVRFDPDTVQLRGDPTTVLSDVRSAWDRGEYDIAHDGTLVYSGGVPSDVGSLVWVDREGSRESLDVGFKKFVAFNLSPDKGRLAVPIREGRNTDIWVYDLDRPQAPARITFGGVHNHSRWSSDGHYLIFSKFEEDGTSTIRAKDIQSGAPPFVIHENTGGIIPLDYHAPTGELLFSTTGGGGMDLMRGLVDLSEGEGATVECIEPLAATRYGEPFAAISPDRKWIVANSDETGRWELFLTSYPDMGSRIQISTTGGEEPLWTDDGARIIYRWNDQWFEVDVASDPRLSVSTPRVVAKGPYINVPGYSWDMTSDAERFLFLENPDQARPIIQLQVITNFHSKLERLVPTRK